MPHSEQPHGFSSLIIVGAGPSGLLLALLLSQHGIPSIVLEAWDRLDERLRATQYGVPATRVFRKAGVLDDFRATGIGKFPGICWRRVNNHQRLTGIDLSVVQDHPDRMTILALNEILQILYRHCLERGKGLIDIRFNHKVVDMGQNDSSAWVDVEIVGAEKLQRFEADYVVGCDGASSAIRRLLFGRNWPGQTFDCRLVVQNVYYDGFEKHGWDGGNYMIDKDYWGLLARRGKDGLWRVTYGDVPGLSEEEYIQRRPDILEKLLPGNPKPGEYRVEQTNIYTTHNRCVEKMRVGRVLLAGDAAHVCNPWGGYGCMTAVLDVGGLAECLVGFYEGKADENILDNYADVRREKFLQYVDARSIRNMRRLQSTQADDELLTTDKLLNILKGLEGDREATKAFLLKTASIEYDFTQHYTNATAPPAESMPKSVSNMVVQTTALES